MRGNAKQLLVGFAAFLVIVGGYIGFRYLSSLFRPRFLAPDDALRLSPQDREKERTSRVSAWVSRPTTVLLSSQLDDDVNAILRKERCVSVPFGGKPVIVDRLNNAQKDDLRVAIVGLLQAYAASDPDALFDYMRARKERLSPDQVKVIQNDLITRHAMNRATVLRYGEKELYRLFWTKLLAAKTHLHALVQDSGCVSLWSADTVNQTSLGMSFGREDGDVFQNTVRFRHCFVPTSDSIESVLKEHRSVTFADIKLVLRYDQARLGEPRPHYIRFWLNPGENTWHPLDLVLIPTVDQTYPHMSF